MEIKMTRQNAPTSLKVVNATMSWTSILLHGALPVLYATKEFQPSKRSLIKLSALSCVTPVVWWAIDALTSPSNVISRNMEIFRQNGYTIPRLTIFSMINGWLHHFGIWLVGIHAFGYKKHFNWKIPLTIIGNLILSDIIFRFVHKSLHVTKLLAPIHLLHHCAKYPGVSVNVIFHPIDITIGLGVPVATILFTYYFISNNKYSCLLSASLLYAWYNFSHDETLNRPHVKHHKAVNGIYTIYSAYDDGTKGELIGGIMRKNIKKSQETQISKRK